MSKLLKKIVRPPPRISPAAWGKQYRRMSAKESAIVGRFSFYVNPYLEWLLEQMMRRDVNRIVCVKSAQVGWTQAAILNVLGWLIHIRKGTAIVMFPKEGAAQSFNSEKFEPMIEGTPELSAIIPIKSRNKDNKQLFKNFVGGFVKFISSNSISDVKSTSARYLFVEEPDDCNLNLRGQGDAIKLLEERGKSFRDMKMLIGGTPSIKGISSIEDEFANSNQVYWHVPCPDCGEYQPLVWEQVQWNKDPELNDEHLGQHKPGTAHYVCQYCGSHWNDVQKNTAIRAGRPVETAPFRGTVGLALNELYSQMHNSRFEMLAEKFIKANKKLKAGDAAEMIVFFNATLGLSWEFKDGSEKPDTLKERGLDYPPMTVARGGLVLTAGIDVQHDRLAVVIRAWGRGEESWLVQWTEIQGNPLDLRSTDDDGNPRVTVWQKLEAILFAPIRHVDNFYLNITAVGIDSSDGNTSDVVYDWVRANKRRPDVLVMAVKGGALAGLEVFSKPRISVDTDYRNTKASKYGLRVFIVGTSKAKDVLIGSHGRLSLEGHGPGRFHFTKHVREDYCEQLLSERKIPKRQNGGHYSAELAWQKQAGKRNEALDCEVYCLHGSRALKLHLKSEADWAKLENELRQTPLFETQTKPIAEFIPLQAVSMMDDFDD